MVNRERDRPVLPTESDPAGLRAELAVAEFVLVLLRR
jgi:hypothetical protein